MHHVIDGFIFTLLPLLQGALGDVHRCLQFGYNLGIEFAQLNEIQFTIGHDIQRCLMQILLQWRVLQPSSSYKEISGAIRQCGYPVLSAIIDRRFSADADQLQKSSKSSSDEYIIIEGPSIMNSFDKQKDPPINC